ncbi:MAG: hypothetical protein IJA24_03825 [Alistipes sp.]|nr:hypothetical protein [Alistipes sp.]
MTAVKNNMIISRFTMAGRLIFLHQHLVFKFIRSIFVADSGIMGAAEGV